jgi:hypothetical protein
MQDHRVSTLTTALDQRLIPLMSDTGLVLPSHLQITMTVIPTMPLQATTSFTPQNLVGTYSHHRMKNLVIPQNPTGEQVPIGGQSSVSGKIPTKGKTSFGGQVPVVTQPMVEGESSKFFCRKPTPNLGTTSRRIFSSKPTRRIFKS